MPNEEVIKLNQCFEQAQNTRFTVRARHSVVIVNVRRTIGAKNIHTQKEWRKSLDAANMAIFWDHVLLYSSGWCLESMFALSPRKDRTTCT